MDKKKLLIVDDERLARSRILRFLRSRKENFELAEAENGVEAIKLISSFKPHLVFLDISLPGLSGIEVLYQVEQRDFAVIFQTAYDRFAIKAFDENACDYLLKPFTEERFHKALDKGLNSTSDSLNGLEQTALQAKKFLQKIIVKERAGLRAISAKDILYFISRDHYTHVGTTSAEYICELSVAHLAERLDPESFKRIHRHCIVRLDAIEKVITGGAMEVLLTNGTKLPISRANQTEILDAFQKN